MRRGFTLVELAVVLAILAVVTSLTLPRLQGLLDWIAVNTAAQDVTTALAVTRNAAIMQSSRRRLVIARDSLRIDRWAGDSWAPLERWPGPDRHGVTLEVSTPVVVFDPIGLPWGGPSTKDVLPADRRPERNTQ